ncbi:TadE/TadG family type IV pilus assembly protein [Achromobacter spanius]|uniref:TadE/TadG family type IV pilus assembly protein n=1 Tax=Achromobacter spanius TaxID=217203 RepID=UPI0037FE823E
MIRRGANERGQAVVEALLMLPLMAVLLWAVSDIGAMQFSAQRTTQAGRQAVMAAALGQPVATLRAPQGMDLAGTAQRWPGSVVAGASLQDEWFGAAMQLLSVQTLTLPRPGNAMFALPISRHLSVAGGAGYAHSDADAQRRVGTSATGWLQASRTSRAEAGRMQRQVGKVEAPWGRPTMSLDWLSAWGDVLPNDRLGKRAEDGR